MTINGVIAALDGLALSVTDTDVYKWCSDLDGQFRRLLERDTTPVAYNEDDGDTVLFVSAPYDEIYYFYCASKSFLKNRQYSDYQNYSGQYEALRLEFMEDYYRGPDYGADGGLTPALICKTMQGRKSGVVHRLQDVTFWCSQVDELARSLLKTSADCPINWTPDTPLLLPMAYMEAYIAYSWAKMASAEGNQVEYNAQYAQYNTVTSRFYGEYRRENRPPVGAKLMIGM